MNPRVAICTPAREHVHTAFYHAMIGLLARSMDACDAIHPLTIQGTILPQQRTMLVDEALSIDKDLTHVLFVDSDMLFPSSALLRLLAHDLDIVGLNYRRKIPEMDSVTRGLEGEKILSTPDRKGIEEVGYTGTGFLLIKRAVFEKTERPWFETTYRAAKGDWLGEDVYFCIQSWKAGFKVYVDHDVSRETKHVGAFDYGWQ